MPKNPMSNIFAYIKAHIGNEGGIELHQANNVINPLENFEEKAKNIENSDSALENSQKFNLFLIITQEEKVSKFEEEMKNEEKNIFEKFKNGNCIELDLENGCYLKCFFKSEQTQMIEYIADYWLSIEEPILYGKQILINSYLLRDLYGRRIIAAYPSYLHGNWNLLLEGGTKLALGTNEIYFNRNITSEDIPIWTQGEISNILRNPCYAYGIVFDPIDLFYEWQRALFYQLAIVENEKLTTEILENIYNDFLEFAKKEICEWITCETMIPKADAFEVIKKQIEEMRKFLQGKQQSSISKNNLITLANRYNYMPAIQEILKQHVPDFIETKNKEFSKVKLQTFLKQLDVESNYEKGIAMEKLAKYFLNAINGIKITGERIKTEKEEIDLCFCNTSLDEKLWKLGVLTLVECKNEKQKFSSEKLKKIVYTMEEKGAKSIILFLREDISKPAEKEIDEQLMYGKYVVVITKKDLEQMREKTAYDLLIEKIESIEKRQEELMQNLI